MSELGEFETTVKYMAPWREWRSECSCGWVGSYLRTESLSQAEAREHLRRGEHVRREARAY